MSSKSKKVKKLVYKLKQEHGLIDNIVPFDCTNSRTILDPTCRKPGDRQYLSNFDDKCMQSIIYTYCNTMSNEELEHFLRTNDLYTEAELASFVLLKLGI